MNTRNVRGYQGSKTVLSHRNQKKHFFAGFMFHVFLKLVLLLCMVYGISLYDGSLKTEKFKHKNPEIINHPDWLSYQDEELHLSFLYPPSWKIQAVNLENDDREVFVEPLNPEAFTHYFYIVSENRSIYDVKKRYAEEVKNASLEDILFDGRSAFLYTYKKSDHREIFIPYGESNVILITTDRYDILDVKEILKSVIFLPTP